MDTDLSKLIPPPTEINNTHKVYSIAAVCIVLGAITTALIFLRLGFRWHSKTLGIDDYAMIPAVVLYIGWTTLAAYMNLSAGVGKPLWEITEHEFEIWFQGILTSAWVYPIMSAAIRVSIILFYLRIFGYNNKMVKYSVWVLLGMQVAYIITFCVLPAFICNPVHKFWKPLERAEFCDDFYYYHTSVALYGASLFFDVALLVLPIFPVWNLQLPLRKKIGVATIFMLGASASVAAAYKLAIFVLEMERYKPTNQIWLSHLLSRFIPGQFDRYGTTFWIPTHVEPTVALIGASIPALYQIVKTAIPELQTKASRISSKKTNHSDSNPVSSRQRDTFQRINDSQIELNSMNRSETHVPV